MIFTAADIDIDVADRDKILAGLSHVKASIKQDDGLSKHNTGVYFVDIPTDPFSGLATYDYEEAESLGYFKIDMLNVSVYKNVQSEEHLVRLMEKEPMWELLDHEAIVQELFHIGKYFDLVKKLKPRSVEQLAMLLAIIRPSKRYLENRPWDRIEKVVWDKPADGSYYFKKAHAISYAMLICVQLNLLEETLTSS